MKVEETDSRRRFSEVLMLSRSETRISQEKMAWELGVARKTVQNWERGVSAPDLEQTIRWFRVLGVPALPYLFGYVFPELSGINSADPEKRLRTALHTLLDELPEEGVRKLLYLFYGDHGSSPRAVLEMVNAHLQCPLKDRADHKAQILRDYSAAKRMERLSSPEHVQPDEALLERAERAETEAAVQQKKSYVL